MGHYEHWREDLAVARDLGARALRWGVPWYRVEPERGKFDWSWTDQVIPYIVEDLGITPIIDLMHYGCPFWLKREFVNPRYHRYVAEYAAAFARRYKNLVRWYTPLNEPLVNALFCGQRGAWPPYLRGDRNYLRILVQLARGIVDTVRAVKEIDPGAIMVHVEATGLTRAMRQDLEALAVEETRRGYLCYDLITGRVTPDHPLFAWLLREGVALDDLAALWSRPIELDIMGMNFYPQWSSQRLDVERSGRVSFSNWEDIAGEGFATLIRDYYDRYKAPVIISETSAVGSDAVREKWLEASVAIVKRLREEGVPVIGYTWFPLYTMIDWRYRFEKGPLKDYYLDLGLYTLDDCSDDSSRWRATPLVGLMRHYISHPEEAVGLLSMEGVLQFA
ncbi:MAG: family 1 glycosylhydrolase [Anaerolineae bacterium]